MTLTREQIESMPAGRDLDALVAEKVIGISVKWLDCGDGRFPYKQTTLARNNQLMKSGDTPVGLRPEGDIPEYSTDISAAWEVVEKIKDNPKYGGDFAVHFMRSPYRKPPSWWAGFYSSDYDNCFQFPWSEAETAALAICRFALLSITPENVQAEGSD